MTQSVAPAPAPMIDEGVALFDNRAAERGVEATVIVTRRNVFAAPALFFRRGYLRKAKRKVNDALTWDHLLFARTEHHGWSIGLKHVREVRLHRTGGGLSLLARPGGRRFLRLSSPRERDGFVASLRILSGTDWTETTKRTLVVHRIPLPFVSLFLIAMLFAFGMGPAAGEPIEVSSPRHEFVVDVINTIAGGFTPGEWIIGSATLAAACVVWAIVETLRPMRETALVRQPGNTT
ncbi:MAG: hypothetical protein AAGI53_12830 [Planctomycetota bacterium]